MRHSLRQVTGVRWQAMRRAVALLTLAAVAAMPLAAQNGRRGLETRGGGAANAANNGGFGTYHAIIFAVGEQQASSGLQSLRFPLKEADSLRAVITREYTFDPKNVQLVRNPTREAILDTLEVLARRLGPDDNLLVVYSGHGGFDEAGKEGYWLAADAANARPSTWIPNESIRTWLRKLKARSVLLITDACFSGSLNRSNDDRVELEADAQRAIAGALMYARRSSRQAMTAGTAKETVPQVSVFSMEIVAALKRRRAPVFMAQQLAGEINPRVAAVAHTTPTFSAIPGIETDQGDFVFVRRNAFADATQPTQPDVALNTGTVVASADPGMRRGGTQPAATPASSTRTPPVGSAAPASQPTPQPVTTAPAPAPAPRTAGNAGSKMGNIGSAPVAVPDAPASAPGTSGPAATARRAPGCDGDTSTGCITLAQNLEYGRNGQTKNEARAVGLYRLACDAGDAEGCMHLGRMYDARHEGVSMDRGRARALYTQACEGGSAQACTFIGVSTLRGDGGNDPNPTKAAVFFAKACDGGHAQGCGYLGAAYATGSGVPQNDSRGRSLLHGACNGGDRQAYCGELGSIYADARGGASRDSARAVGFWKQGCDAADPSGAACVAVGTAYLRGSGTTRDDAKAVQYLSQACESRVAGGCAMLAGMYELGTSATAKSATRAFTYYKRACDGGDQRGCAWVRANPQAAPAPAKD